MKIKNCLPTEEGKFKIILLGILLLGFFLRVYGLNWDQGNHLHPDERAIVMFALPLKLPSTFSEFFSIQSPWNPHFFAYGSFPLYLLKISGNILSNFDPLLGSYDKINLVGRAISAFFDLGSLFVIFLLAKKLFNKKIALLAGFFYAISTLPIQLAHFYAVDTILTFFITLTLYCLINFYEKPNFKNSLFVGFFFGLSLATKTSALVLILAIGTAIAIDFILIFLKNPHRPHTWFPHIPKFLKRLFVDGITMTAATTITFLLAEPYALIDFKEFWKQTLEQSQMTRDAFTFPYTLQYVGKTPYLYELKNVFLWGLGPVLATLSFLGLFYFSYKAIKQLASPQGGSNNKAVILLVFFIIYFAVVGKFAVGWMRYMLPLYPLLCLFGGLFAWHLLKFIQNKFSHHKFSIFNFKFLILLALLAWPLSFMHIYSKPNTRVLASEWINQNIPPGATLAIEHWDDSLPLFGQQNYNILTLTLYDPDTSEKWQILNDQLLKTDYIVIASNRLHVPLQKLTDCEKLKPHPCYRETASYYKKLFSGKLGFRKVVEFENSPTIPIINILINDQGADESFTVYDHPKVLIFKK
ncbi:MAG: glycosyltransferase family 39 protein [Candidatus Levybacteria bacterium]|nr:glycosyltransferase family 39 protein [Candidatus Levybacteria bacterium]